MIKKILNHPKIAALFLGMLSSFAFAPVYALVLMFVCLASAMKLADMAGNWRKAAAIGYWYGFGLFMAGFYWVGNALLIDIVSFGWLYPITLLGAGAFFGLFTILPFVMLALYKTPVIKVLNFAAMWVLMEWVRSFIFTGFPWNLAGTAWAFHPVFIQTASLWGTYGLSFITIVLSGCFYLFFNGARKVSILCFSGTVAVMVGFGFWRLSAYDRASSDIVVRLVQPSIPQVMKWEPEMLAQNLNEYIELSRKNGFEDVDFVVWGETAAPFYIDPKQFDWRGAKAAVPPKGHLITGSLRFDGFQAYNSMFVLDPDLKLAAYYDKHHLVPFGEYIPFRRYLPEWIRPIANSVADFGSGQPFKSIKLDNIPAFGALICYEIIFPDEVIDRQNKPSWLVVLSNDGWYGKSSGPYQHLAMTQMRAVEEGVTVVRSANTGISAVINPMGEIIDLIALDQKGMTDVKLPQVLDVDTTYNCFGKYPIIIFMLLIICISSILKKH